MGTALSIRAHAQITPAPPAQTFSPTTTITTTNTTKREIQTRYLIEEAKINETYDEIERYKVTSSIISHWRIDKGKEARSFLHLSLTLPPSQSSSTSRTSSIRLLTGSVAAEDLLMTTPKSRILEILTSPENAVFQDFEPLAEFSDLEIRDIYDRFLKGPKGYPWMAINSILVRNHSNTLNRGNYHRLTAEEREKWENLFEIYELWRRYGKDTVESCWLRDVVAELLAWMVAVHRRWGIEGCDGILAGLEREKVTLLGEGDYVYEVVLGVV